MAEFTQSEYLEGCESLPEKKEYARLYIAERILAGLVETILDNTKLCGSDLKFTYQADEPILMVVKTFFGVDYQARVHQLKEEEE